MSQKIIAYLVIIAAALFAQEGEDKRMIIQIDKIGSRDVPVYLQSGIQFDVEQYRYTDGTSAGTTTTTTIEAQKLCDAPCTMKLPPGDYIFRGTETFFGPAWDVKVREENLRYEVKGVNNGIVGLGIAITSLGFGIALPAIVWGLSGDSSVLPIGLACLAGGVGGIYLFANGWGSSRQVEFGVKAEF